MWEWGRFCTHLVQVREAGALQRRAVVVALLMNLKRYVRLDSYVGCISHPQV